MYMYMLYVYEQRFFSVVSDCDYIDEFKYCEGLSADWSRMERLVQARLVREETPMTWVWRAFNSSRESWCATC